MLKKPILLLFSVIAIIVASTSILRTSCSGPPKYNPTVDRCLGERMAVETARLINGQGDVVVLSAAGGEFTHPMAEAQIKGFEKGLQKYREIRVAAVEGPEQENAQDVPEVFFMSVVKKYPNAKVIVSFLGPPIFSAEGEKIDATRLPKVVAFDLSGQGKWKQLVKNGVVSTVVGWRHGVNWSQPDQKSDCNTLFDSRYIIITKTNNTEIQ